MTMNERVQLAIENHEFNSENAGVDELIAFAYFLGRCEAAKEVCDKAKEIFSEQNKQVEHCRYYKMASKIQGNIKTIYHSDYDQWIKMFANDKTNV